jgi:hypothetical protein
MMLIDFHKVPKNEPSVIVGCFETVNSGATDIKMPGSGGVNTAGHLVRDNLV